MTEAFGFRPLFVGIVLALVTLCVVVGGAKRIFALTERMVPLMTLVYILLSAAVLILRRHALPEAAASVFREAFRPQSVAGGTAGFLLSRAVRFGTLRGLMSNEAGCGTAPIAHAESTDVSPAEQGLWGIFEVFADTVVLCTLTAAVVLVSVDDLSVYGADGMRITLSAYCNVLGNWCEPILAVLVLFFAFATVICRAHYGKAALAFLTRNAYLHRSYAFVYSAFVLVGTLSSPDLVWLISDASIGLMTAINLLFLYAMRREVKAETEMLIAKIKRKKCKSKEFL